MAEVDELKNHLAQGFQAAMVLRDPAEDELRQRKLPTAYFSGKVKALPMWHKDGRKLMYYLREPEAIAFAVMT